MKLNEDFIVIDDDHFVFIADKIWSLLIFNKL